MSQLSIDLLRRLGICYEPIDGEGRIIPVNPEFWAMAEAAFPSEPVDVCDAFAEAVGSEDQIAGVIRSGSGEYRLAGFRRGRHYLNISVLPYTDAELIEACPGARGVIVLQDATAEMLAKQAVVQSKNEASILGEALRDRNRELQSANGRLDELMRTIRSHNHDLDMQVKRRTAELLRSRLSVISTLARVAEFRDTDTSRHTFRIGQGSALIGRYRGMPDAECEQLFYASLLHDIGKIGIPDSILLKPGPLDGGEWEIMRGHTRIGAEILDNRDHSLFGTARQVALYHHERWDGGGYPEGLAGEAIPVVGRICAILDVFDALISRRPYKEAWPVEKAVETIRSQSGKQFDPSVVEAFLAIADQLITLHDEDGSPELLPPELE